MKGMLLPRDAPAAALGSIPGGHVGFQPDNRYDSGILRLPEQLDRPVKVAVVRERQAGIPRALARSTRSGILLAPSRRL